MGSESPLEYDLDIRQSRAHWAPALSWAWDSGWRLETSAAFSQRSRLAQGTASDTSYLSPFNTTQLLPRLGASKSLGSAWTAFVQASTGFSDPTNFESLSTDITGALPAVLDAERAWTLESGFRHSQGEIVLYHQTSTAPSCKRSIRWTTPRLSTTPRPVTMQGIEWRAQQTWPRHRLQGSGTFQFHRWARRRLARIAQVDGQRPAPLEGWDRNHTWTLQTWIRAVGATHSTPAATTSIPRTPQPMWTSAGRLHPRLWPYPSGFETPPTRPILDGINSMGLVANSTTLRLREPCTCRPSGTCVDVSTAKSIQNHHLHPAVQGTAFLRLVVRHRV